MIITLRVKSSSSLVPKVCALVGTSSQTTTHDSLIDYDIIDY